MFTMKKQMLIDGHQLPVILRRNVVSIDNNPVLWSFINQNPLRNTQKLIDYIQADYQKIFGEKFPLSDNSFIMEIWGHMYFESFLVNYKKWRLSQNKTEAASLFCMEFTWILSG